MTTERSIRVAFGLAAFCLVSGLAIGADSSTCESEPATMQKINWNISAIRPMRRAIAWSPSARPAITPSLTSMKLAKA
jgi:hypothetical protein